MERSRRTSPYYQAWLDAAPRSFAAIKRALDGRDLDTLGRAMEHSTFAFHACALAADPAIAYFRPATLAALETVRALRDAGVSAWATMDAGPHVKVLCAAGDAGRVQAALDATAGVLDTLVARPGAGVEVRR